jgi:hypothetical protein
VTDSSHVTSTKNLRALATKRNVFILVSAAFFVSIPPRVFIAISSDIIQVAAILLPFVLAFMVIIATADITFGLPTNATVAEKLSERREKMRVQLIDTISDNFWLIIGAIVAKAICTWLIGCGEWLATGLMHIASLIVGVLLVLCFDRITGIVRIFNHFMLGQEFGLAVKTHVTDGKQ